MKPLITLTWLDLKLYLRNWIAAFFTLVFPLMMLFLFGGMYGNQPSPYLDGYGTVDISIPGYITAMIIGTTGLVSLPMELASRRQLGVLRRLRATPLPAFTVLGSQLAVNLILSVLGATVLIVAGIVFYHARMPASWMHILMGFFVCCLSIYGLGFLLASVVRKVNTARAVSMVLFYPMMFLSGGTIPSVFLPEAAQKAAALLPMTYAVNLMQDLWFGKGWNTGALLVLGGILGVSCLVSARFFQWE